MIHDRENYEPSLRSTCVQNSRRNREKKNGDLNALHFNERKLWTINEVNYKIHKKI